MEAILRGQAGHGFNTYIQQSKLSQTNNIIILLEYLRKRTTGQIPNPWTETLVIKVGVGGMERTYTESCSFKKISIIGKPLGKVTKRGRTRTNKISYEKERIYICIPLNLKSLRNK